MFVFKGFSHPKDPQSGTTEDAWRADNLQNVVVVSDGASSTLFSGLWANLLCDGVINNCPDPMDHFNFPQWLETLRAKWTSNIDYNSLSWYQKPKIASGACATLAWASIEPSAEIPDNLDDDTPLDTPFFRVSGYAIGDACVMRFHAGKLVSSIPISRSADFDTTPLLLSSVNTGIDVSTAFVPFDFIAPEGDWIILATDAMSQWILQLCESGDVPDWLTLWSATPEQFADFVESQRELHNIHVDDTTVVICCLGTQSYLSREFNLNIDEQVIHLDDYDYLPVERTASVEETPQTVKNVVNEEVLMIDEKPPLQRPIEPTIESKPISSGFSSDRTYRPTSTSSATQKTVSMSSVFLDFSSTDGPAPEPKKQNLVLPTERKSEPKMTITPPPPVPKSVPVTEVIDKSTHPTPPPIIQHDTAPRLKTLPRSVTPPGQKTDKRTQLPPQRPPVSQYPQAHLEKKIHPSEEVYIPPIPSDKSDNQEEYKIVPQEPVKQTSEYAYAQRLEKQKLAELAEEEHREKEKEDNFAYQFQKGMTEGIQDMKEGFRDMVNGQLGEQTKEALEKGKEALKKGTEKVTKMFSGWFKKKE